MGRMGGMGRAVLQRGHCVADADGMGGKKRSIETRIRILVDGAVAVGPGRADMLEAIEATGSIAAAGRRMGMSYKRAWMLVESMNDYFKTPLVETSRGGRARGGAALTAAGERVLALYRRMERRSAKATAKEMGEIRRLLREGLDED